MLPRQAPLGRASQSAAGPLIRSARRLLAPTAAALCAVAVGCGGDDAAPAPQATALVIQLDADGPGGDPASRATVECPGDGGRACAAVAALPPDPTAAVPPQTACTEIYGGPDVVVIRGTLDGEDVDARLTRANGCEIDRFDRFAELLSAAFPGYSPGQALGL